MAHSAPTLGLLLLVGVSLCAALTDWQEKSFNLCLGQMDIGCGGFQSHQLVVKSATYRSSDCYCGDCRDLRDRPAIGDVGICNRKSSCAINLRPYEEVDCNCHQKHIDLRYGCVTREELQVACGDTRAPFEFKDHAFVSNPHYPKSEEAKSCSIIFRVGQEKAVTVRTVLNGVPAGWTMSFCNLTSCIRLYRARETTVRLVGNSHVRIDRETNPASQIIGKNMTFMFEYEVDKFTIPRPPVIPNDVKPPSFHDKDLGVTKLENRYKRDAIIAGVTCSVLLVLVLIGTICYIRRRWDQPEKVVPAPGDRTTFSQKDMYLSDTFRLRNSRYGPVDAPKQTTDA